MIHLNYSGFPLLFIIIALVIVAAPVIVMSSATTVSGVSENAATFPSPDEVTLAGARQL
jgi:hypothetical protein